VRRHGTLAPLAGEDVHAKHREEGIDRQELRALLVAADQAVATDLPEKVGLDLASFVQLQNRALVVLFRLFLLKIRLKSEYLDILRDRFLLPLFHLREQVPFFLDVFLALLYLFWGSDTRDYFAWPLTAWRGGSP
jgi:hypothetical protein